MTFNPHTDADRRAMLDTIGVESFDELVAVIPEEFRNPDLNLPERLTEMEAAEYLGTLAGKNHVVSGDRNFLGAGSYRHYIPAAVDSLIQRGEILTAYTPYQPEVSQGTLQIIYEFQSLVAELFQMDVANASLYDGATALAEACLMALGSTRGRDRVVVSGTVHPNYREVIQTYLSGHDSQIELLPVPENYLTDAESLEAVSDQETAAIVVQYPNFFGGIEDLKAARDLADRSGAALIVATYPVPLALLQPPGAFGADIVTGEGQGLGIAQTFGGPYLGLLAAKQSYVRKMPGRLSGKTTDENGNRGFVLTLQTREQHIRRDKATSNICTNQGLMATAATIHMSLLGKHGLEEVASRSYSNAHYLATQLSGIPEVTIANRGEFFNEFVIRTPVEAKSLNSHLIENGFSGGFDLGTVDQSGVNDLLVATTELNDKAGMDALVESIRELVS